MYTHELGFYTENEDFLCLDDSESHIRSQNIILHSKWFKWHIKITFNGKLITEDIEGNFVNAQKQYSIRRQQLEAFTFFIKFECLPLLENTVTEIEFGLSSSVTTKLFSLKSNAEELFVKNGYYQFMNKLYYQIREDSSRTQYPRFIKDSSLSAMTLITLHSCLHYSLDAGR